MKINKLQINSFGNIENKEIELSNNINIIKGKNESGKSTLLKFIVDMLYGISKNKRGKEFSDYDRYKPWSGEEFSGKILYELDDNSKYEVFRDFNKKNPKIYNEAAEDISKEFTIDKTYGNQFFYEQTNVDEQTFLNTFASCQTEVKLEKQEQNTLVQKLANLAGTGDDNVSYKKAMEKINKKQVEEIGTIRTTGRPINIVKDEKYKLQDEIGELEEFKDKKYEIEEEKNNIEDKILQNEKRLEALKEAKRIVENEKIAQEKVAIHERMINSDEEKIHTLKSEKQEIENKLEELKAKNITNKAQESKKEKIKGTPVYVAALIIGIILLLIGIKNMIIAGVAVAIIIIDAILVAQAIAKKNKKLRERQYLNEQENRKKEEEQKQIESELERLSAQIEMLAKGKEDKTNEIQKEKQLINLELETKRKLLCEKYKIDSINFDSISYEIEELQKNINRDRLSLHSLELDKNNIMPKLEKLASMEEELEELNEKEQSLNEQNKAIELAKEILETAYIKMKENVTPKFTQELSKNIQEISNGKYKNVRINDEEGIIVEKKNGEYVSSEKLSIGTIEQLYLSLRFGAIKEISNETMPIILDEAFAYYDEQRLTNVLKYLNEEFKQNQIIIFTCTNREEEILEKENIQYKLTIM